MKHSGSFAPLRRSRALAFCLLLLALLLLALHLYVRFLPRTPTPIPGPADAESAWWGLWPVTYAPAPLFWLGAAAVLAAVGMGVAAVLRPAPAAQNDRDVRRHPALALLSLLLVAAFFLFPVAHTRWGDAYLISRSMAWPDPALRLTHSWQAPLDVYLHSRLWLWLGPRFGWEDAVPVYRMLSPLAGALYLAAALGLSARRALGPPWLPYGLLATLGVVQLFFGYVENYSFAAAGIVLYLWLALLVLGGRAPLWGAASVLAVTHALHPSTIVLAPSLLALGWLLLRRGPQGNKGRAAHVFSVGLQIALPMLIVGVAVFAGMEWAGHGLDALRSTDRPGGSDSRWFVPLWQAETRWEHYTFLSWLHLRDLLNGQLLVAPVVLPSLLLALLFAGRAVAEQEADERPPFVFLAAAALGYLLFVLVWNPDYGGQRDWDLFGLHALPLSVLAALALARALPEHRLLRAAVGPLLLLQALHTAAWIYANTLPWEWPA